MPSTKLASEEGSKSQLQNFSFSANLYLPFATTQSSEHFIYIRKDTNKSAECIVWPRSSIIFFFHSRCTHIRINTHIEFNISLSKQIHPFTLIPLFIYGCPHKTRCLSVQCISPTISALRLLVSYSPITRHNPTASDRKLTLITQDESWLITSRIHSA